MRSLDNSQQVACTNCQTVTTNDGKTVWVCQSCGNENAVTTVTAPAQPAQEVPVAAPVVATPAAEIPAVSVDAASAQAAISDAAAAVAAAPAAPVVATEATATPAQTPQV